jgi:hypothetical protein
VVLAGHWIQVPFICRVYPDEQLEHVEPVEPAGHEQMARPEVSEHVCGALQVTVEFEQFAVQVPFLSLS